MKNRNQATSKPPQDSDTGHPGVYPKSPSWIHLPRMYRGAGEPSFSPGKDVGAGGVVRASMYADAPM